MEIEGVSYKHVYPIIYKYTSRGCGKSSPREKKIAIAQRPIILREDRIENRENREKAIADYQFRQQLPVEKPTPCASSFAKYCKTH